ncbi:tRNA (adenosine(37)-N6)-dimethylallyltransferase MiaA [Arcticibacterium luteifluviistationis]|uniref:tRNA dimethylallyltransferase n=1 Tax=Arcticibacterium luteifluviistationis TaxID=1784714 RepID=A0A2Z4GAC7_9BACT|nr:tRNA (adenosine(37)-N6)-dimethylallyltransferase MiaA [Arcticibacterium luteifluviistationis]AWV98157.1 tRNA (adenosine(37)-N6)-dimethylallyltransferase MiaA [Arcticibacterium luteifluviistationis]
MKKQKYLVLIVGPTAVGKTDLCLSLAKKLDAEIFSCDSRQFYKEISIGTAKPTAEELAQVPHHFINNLHIDQNYTVADFEKEVLEKLDAYFIEKDVAIMTGGSGLFAKAITHGFDNIPDTPTSLRDELKERLETEGLENLVTELRNLDPTYCLQADLSNAQRVIRALEVSKFTGKPFSSWQVQKKQTRPFGIIKIALELPREELYNRINHRVDLMLNAGLLEEVKSVSQHSDKNALQTVGYKEVFDFLNGNTDKETMIELIKRNTRRYAKRQMTWFRNQDTFKWFSPMDPKSIIQYIMAEIK